MEPRKRSELFAQFPTEENASQSIVQTSIIPVEDQRHGSSRDQRNLRPVIDNWELQQLGEFQDSRLSPALSLLPSNSGVQHNFTEYSLFQQTDMEFAPLRASPDISVASERFHVLPQDRTSQASDHGSLSQHPLAHATGLSEDGASSCCSLSQHSMSPGDEGRHAGTVHSPADGKRGSGCAGGGMGSKERDGQKPTDPPYKPMGVGAEDDTSFLSGDIPARQLLELLQKDIGMPSGSSSAVSSASETSLRRAESSGGESKTAGVSRPDVGISTGKREDPLCGPPSSSLQETRQPKGKSHPRMSEISNITIRSHYTQVDDSSEVLHRELLSDIERSRSREAGSKIQQQGGPTLEQESVTPNVHPTGMYTGKPSATQAILAGVCGTGPRFSAGYSVDRGQWERDRWSSGNQTGIEGSFLGCLPQSQSTPGVFNAPMKSSAKAPLGRLSAIESNVETSVSGSRTSARSPIAMVDIDATDPHAAPQGSETPHQEATSEKVQALPSLNYMQKVDAWRANQSSGKTSLFDNLALRGFSGVSPKQRAYDSVSESLNRMLNQQEKDALLQLPFSSTTNQNLALSPSVAHSGHSTPQRGEAVGSAPNDKDKALAAAGPSASPLGRSQSHSSLSTVITSMQQVQQTPRLAEQESGQTKERGLLQSSAAVQPSPLVGLGMFSDVSFNRDTSGTTHSNSPNSYNSGLNLGASMGASSVVSLEVDNYAPYWSSKPSTPPKAPELNIEERIPLYLLNLGIDQSPSTILTPFAPRGPIREPEFSPTDLCTIKGSIGTPTKSTQPSEGGSPNKGEFSRSSLLSVDSSMSIPLSVDSLYPVLPFQEQTRASPSSDTAGSQGGLRTAPGSQPLDVTSLPALQPNQQQQSASSQNTTHLRVESGSSSLPATGYKDGDLESHSQSSHSIEQSNYEDSFVGSKTLKDIRKLLGQAENTVSGGTSVASASSSSSGGSRLHSDDDALFSLGRKTGRFQDSFTSSSAAGGSGTHSSLLWARSSSDSMLTAERLRESSVGRESMQSPGQAVYQSAQALSTPPASDAHTRPEDGSVSTAAGSSLLLSKSARRAEPEGCSAAPPDNTGPPQPPVIKPAQAASKPQPAPGPRETAGVAEETGGTPGGTAESGSSSPVPGDPEQGAMSDGSSEGSLAARVAKLLQNESPATMVSSRPSTADQDESRAREWIKLKVSGQQCEPLELDVEDRKRIEEIKKELLLTHPLKSQASTDTDSSVVSSLGGPGGQPLPKPAQPFTALTAAEDRLSHQLQSLTAKPVDSNVQLHSPLSQDLEARVQEIAVREGVTLPRAKPPSLTSITIATCRRSSSPSPSPSPAPPLSPDPEPLCLNQLSTGTIAHHTASRQIPDTVIEEDSAASTQTTPRDPVSTSESNGSLNTGDQNPLDPQSEPQGRQDALGGRQDQPSPSSLTQDREDVIVGDNNTQASRRRDLQDTSTAFGRDDQGTDEPPLPGRYSGNMGQGVDGATGSSSVDLPNRTGHISHLHLTLSPKVDDQTLATGIQARHASSGPGLQSREFAPLRHSSNATSSPDEGIGLSSPIGSYKTREPIRAVPERADTSMLFKTIVPGGEMTSFVPPQRLAASPRPLAIQTPAVPVLLPYKPHGSEELFYMPQAESQASPTRSDTTVESSHPGSDDAVPPRFSSEVLGSRDPGLARGITIKHTEGIYSKRLKTATFKMQAPGHRGSTASVDGSSQTSASRASQPSSPLSGAFTRVPLSSTQGPSGSRRDQGTSPVQFLSYNQAEESRGFRPVHVERDHSVTVQHPSTHSIQRSVPRVGTEREQARRDPDFTQTSSRQTCSAIEQLWRVYSERWSLEEGHPTNEREALLLERLERLSRLIHSTEGVTVVSESEDSTHQHPHASEQEPRGRIEEDVLKRRERKENVMVKSLGGEERRGRADRKAGGGREVEGKTAVPRQAWMQETQVQAEAAPRPAEEDGPASPSSSPSHSSSQSPHHCPAERDESETNSSMSTVDTARLIQAFGAGRVRRLKTGSSLSKLYSAIDKQREGKEQRSRRGKTKDTAPILAPPETAAADDSIVVSDSASSTSTSYTLPSQHGPTHSLAAKKAVKVVSRGIQAGDLEIVSNATRRHTRDVGTTFPSPALARGSRRLSASSSSTLERSPSKSQVLPKERKSKRGQSKRYPQGVTWFVPAEELRAEARKENRPEEEEWVPQPSSAWFQPYRRTCPWREPLRQRQVQEDGPPANRPRTSKPGIILSEPESGRKTTSSGLVRVSLQEALELRRPEFVSQSRERMKRLALQVEERKLQAIFSRERDELFNHPGDPVRLTKPAGTEVFRRAVPRKEMVQRSKQIYERLPEVQRRREEERRKAEYRSYRLNAQLYNKKITNRVLGKRTPWQ